MSTPNINLEDYQLIRQSHSGKALDYKIENQNALTSEEVLKQSKETADKILRKDKHIPSKDNFKLHCLMEHINPETGESKEEEVFFSTPALTIQSEEDISEVYDEASDILAQKLYKFMSEGSSWHLKEVKGLHIHISLYDPINGSCYIDLPACYKNKKSLINIQNDDDMCVKWAITISLNPSDKNKGRITKQVIKDSEKYDWTGINFPMQYKDIIQFEKNNPNIGVVAFKAGDEEEKNIENIHPFYETRKNLPKEKIAFIFFIKGHCCAITDEQKFLNKGEKNMFLICRRCGYKAQKDGKGYSAEDRLQNHMRYCLNHDFCLENFPKVGENILKFKKWEAIVKHPITISFDFECLLKKCDSGNMKKSKIVEEHIPIGFEVSF